MNTIATLFPIVVALAVTAAVVIRQVKRLEDKVNNMPRSSLRFERITTFGGPAITHADGTLMIHGDLIQVRVDCWHGQNCVCFKKQTKSKKPKK